MIKAAATIAAAACLAAVLTAIPAPRVEAGTADAASAATAATSAACRQRAWPYYGQDCLTGFEARWQGEARKVRLVPPL